MTKKILMGLMNKRIVLVDQDKSLKAKKQALREGCDTVIVADATDEIRKKWFTDEQVSMDDFTGVEL